MPKEKPTPDGRAISIKTRTTKLTNVNTKPEAHGNEKVPRADLSIEFTLTKGDVDEILVVDGGSQVLWHESGPRKDQTIFPELDGWLDLKFAAQGLAKFGPVRGELTEFEEAVLKKVSVRLGAAREVDVRAQVRVDSEGAAEELQRLHCAGLCRFSFKGAVLVDGPPEPDDKAPGQRDIEDVDEEPGRGRSH